MLHSSREPSAAPQGAMGAGAPCSMTTLHSAAPQASAGAAAEKPHSVLRLMPDQTVLPNEGALQSACNAEFLMLPRALLHTEGETGAGGSQQGARSPRPPGRPPCPCPAAYRQHCGTGRAQHPSELLRGREPRTNFPQVCGGVMPKASLSSPPELGREAV